MVDGAMSEHLEVLRNVLGMSIRRVEGVGEAHAFQRGLGYASDCRGRFDAQCVKDGGHHINGVGVLLAHLAPSLDAFRPGDDEWVGRATAVSLPLPAAEGRVAGPGPAPGVVIVALRATQLVDLCQVVVERLRDVVEEEHLVD